MTCIKEFKNCVNNEYKVKEKLKKKTVETQCSTTLQQSK